MAQVQRMALMIASQMINLGILLSMPKAILTH